MKILAIQNNTNNYNKINKTVTPSFKSSSVMTSARRFLTSSSKRRKYVNTKDIFI